MAEGRKTRSDTIFSEEVLDTATEIHDKTYLTWPEIAARLPDINGMPEEVNAASLRTKVSQRRSERGETVDNLQGGMSPWASDDPRRIASDAKTEEMRRMRVDGMTYDEIGDQYGISGPAVHHRFRRLEERKSKESES